MLEFRPIEITDREWVQRHLQEANVRSCEYTFVNNFIWGDQYELRIAEIEGFYCSITSGEDGLVYSFPSGVGDVKHVIEMLMEDAKERNIPFVLRGLVKEQLDCLNNLFPNIFESSSNRDEVDYIYTVEKLSKLSGKKLHGKRNHIARFKDNPNWVYEDISDTNIEDCLQMNKEWCAMYKCIEDPSLNHELCAVKRAFAHYDELEMVGGLIRREGKVIAYTIGSRITEDTFDVHIEKAFPDIQGAYPMINQQFVLHNCMEYTYVNREEDLGDQGLRKAKLSYYPDILLEKFTAKMI